MNKTLLVSLLPLLLFLSGCSGNAGEHTVSESYPVDPYYLAGTKERRAVLKDLFVLLNEETAKPDLSGEEVRFSAVQEIAAEFVRQKEYRRLINFLTAWTNTHPEDAYAAYYLLMTAYAHLKLEAYPAAALYFDLIIKNYPDLIVRGTSIHFDALNQLITLVRDPERLVWYYEELISRFPDKITPGITYFMLGRSYEQTGEWNKAIEAYTKFLPFYGAVIPGFPDAYAYAKRLVDFNNSPKDWTFESLAGLQRAAAEALDTGNSARLWRYRAKVNFFVRSWSQDAESEDTAEFNLSDLMRGNRISYAARFDSGSNAGEAYLRTWGWSEPISTWYFYFRKIYFPSNPDIHGRWEWAGVYYGEKF